MMQDLRYGWRQLKKSPVFTLTAVLSLGLGIGASVTMFSAFRAVFLRALPYRDAGQVIEIERHGVAGDTSGTTVADAEFLRRYGHALQSVEWVSPFEIATLSRVDEPANLWVRSVSRGLFPLLGSKPLLGRTLDASDYKSDAQPGVVLSYDTWQRYFRSDPRILEQQIFLSGEYPPGPVKAFRVVGVMPPDFVLPRAGIAAWLPDRTPVSDPLHAGVNIVARLRTGASLEEARAELQQLAPTLQRSYPPSERNWRFSLQQIGRSSIEDYRHAFSLLLAAAGFLVLIACLNVANLLLARGAARSDEFAIRGALGASRGRLVGQVLTESLGLAVLGGGLGVLLAYAGNRLLLLLIPRTFEIPRLGETRMDLVVLGFALLLTVLVGVLFGLAPALSFSSKRLASAPRQGRSSRAQAWPSHLLLMAEVAVSLMLLAGAVLMIRGFVRLANVNPGIRTAHVLTAGIPPGHTARMSKEQLVRRYRDLLATARQVPGVEQAALTSALPMGKIVVSLHIFLPGSTASGQINEFHAVSGGYFGVMGIPLLAGRLFHRFESPEDKGAVVINQEMAHEYWPGQNPIGQRLSSEAPPHAPDLTVVGVVGNVQHRSLAGKPVPEFYQAYQQYLGPTVGTTVVLRTFGDPRSVALSLRKAIHKFDPEQVIENEQTMETTVSETIGARRLITVLIGVFGALAFVLTLVGVYGVASYGISLRTREFGIRMSLGADRGQLIGMLLRQGLKRALLGVCAGAAGAWALARLMTGLVYGVPVRDPVSLAVAAMLLIAGALLAYYVPARRNTKIDPASVLRQE